MSLKKDQIKKLTNKSPFLRLSKTLIKPRNNSSFLRTLFTEPRRHITTLVTRKRGLKPKTVWRRLIIM